MNQDKYIENIIKRLKCSKAKREDIRKQLESDIDSACKNGESFIDIMERMGTPEGVASEFNDNFPEAERKAAKKRNRIIILSIIGVLLLGVILLVSWWWPKTGAVGKSGLFEESTIREQSEAVIRMLDNEDYNGLKQQANETMQTMLDEEGQSQWDAAKAQIGADWGDFVSFGKIYMTELKQMGKQYAVVQLNTSYENVSVTYTITFDKEMKLAGLYMK